MFPLKTPLALGMNQIYGTWDLTSGNSALVGRMRHRFVFMIGKSLTGTAFGTSPEAMNRGLKKEQGSPHSEGYFHTLKFISLNLLQATS